MARAQRRWHRARVLWQSGKNFIVHKHYYIRHFQKPAEELNFFREELNLATEQLNYSYTTCSRPIKFFPEEIVSPLFSTAPKRSIGNKVLP
jgi:hypothetical protein